MLFEQLKHALHARCPAYAGRRFAADLVNQVVVTSTRADGALRAQAFGDEFKHGGVVVIKPAYQTRVDAKGYAIGGEYGLQCLKACERVCAQKVNQTRRSGNHLLHGRVFGIEYAQRVAVQAAAGIFVEQGSVLLKVGNECGAVLLALIGLPQAVDFKAHIAYA